MKKAGQIDISFNMIFSIILIIIFISLGIYVAVVLLSSKGCIETGVFGKDLQDAISSAWNSDETSRPLQLSLAPSIKEVCFVNITASQKGIYKEEYSEFKMYNNKKLNMFFYPMGTTCEGFKGLKIEHIDIPKITQASNPYCIKNTGKITFQIEGYYAKLVVVR